MNAACFKRNVGTTAAAAAKLLQSCPTLCDPIDGSPPGSPVPGILQARTPEWVAISFSNAWKWKVKGKSLSRLLATPWNTAYQAPPSMGFSRQEYWSGVPLPSLVGTTAGYNIKWKWKWTSHKILTGMTRESWTFIPYLNNFIIISLCYWSSSGNVRVSPFELG